ncbi:MAG: hypothetical protein JSS09_06545, partial [Verrucomicrobia bacterium]|nr:hypothetical protein [Verrucomicrobiota bacterium]
MMSSKLKWGILSLFCIVFLVMGGLTLVFWKEMDQMTKFGKTIAKRQKNEDLIMGQVTSTLVDIMKTVGKGLILYPPQFKNVICAQLLGIVKDVKQVKIDPIYAPYNASILEKEEGGYHLFFRYDVIRNDVNTNSYHSHIGYAALDDYFFVTDVIEKVNTKSSFSEDPRVVRVGKSLFLSWNDVIDDEHYARSIHLGEWNPRKGKLEYITNLQQNINIIEKNWMPFEKKEKQEAFLSFVYGVYPHKIIDLLNPKKNEITYPQYKGYNALHDLKWS